MCRTRAALGSSSRGQQGVVRQVVVAVVVVYAMGRVRLCVLPGAVPHQFKCKKAFEPKRRPARSREAVKCVEAAVSLIKRRGRAANRLIQDAGAAFRPWLRAMVGNRNQVSHADDDDDADLPEAGNIALGSPRSTLKA